MRLSDDDIKSFQALYKEQFGKEISKEDALLEGIKLLTLMSHVYQPMTKAEYKRIQERRKNTLPLLHQKITNL